MWEKPLLHFQRLWNWKHVCLSIKYSRQYWRFMLKKTLAFIFKTKEGDRNISVSVTSVCHKFQSGRANLRHASWQLHFPTANSQDFGGRLLLTCIECILTTRLLLTTYRFSKFVSSAALFDLLDMIDGLGLAISVEHCSELIVFEPSPQKLFFHKAISERKNIKAQTTRPRQPVAFYLPKCFPTLVSFLFIHIMNIPESTVSP